MMKRTLEITIPEGITIGEIREAQGAIMQAATEFVDWAELHEGGSPNAVSRPGKLLMEIQRELGREI